MLLLCMPFALLHAFQLTAPGVQTELTAPDSFVLVCNQYNRLVGTAVAWHLAAAQEVQLLQLAVDPACRRTGIGTELVQHLISSDRCANTYVHAQHV